MRYFEDIEIGRRVQAGPYEVTQEEILTKGTLTNQGGQVVLEIVATGLFSKRPA